MIAMLIWLTVLYLFLGFVFHLGYCKGSMPGKVSQSTQIIGWVVLAFPLISDMFARAGREVNEDTHVQEKARRYVRRRRNKRRRKNGR